MGTVLTCYRDNASKSSSRSAVQARGAILPKNRRFSPPLYGSPSGQRGAVLFIPPGACAPRRNVIRYRCDEFFSCGPQFRPARPMRRSPLRAFPSEPSVSRQRALPYSERIGERTIKGEKRLWHLHKKRSTIAGQRDRRIMTGSFTTNWKAFVWRAGEN